MDYEITGNSKIGYSLYVFVGSNITEEVHGFASPEQARAYLGAQERNDYDVLDDIDRKLHIQRIQK